MLLELVGTVAACLLALGGQGDDPPPVTWDTLDARMNWEAKHGYSGVVLVARDGKVAFHKAYGLANRDKKIAMRPDTILAIGSTPIDFTKAGILLLAQRGKLKLSDPITKYFENVPADKRPITIQQLMSGRSGLQDFHDLPTDRDPNHSLDRPRRSRPADSRSEAAVRPRQRAAAFPLRMGPLGGDHRDRQRPELSGFRA